MGSLFSCKFHGILFIAIHVIFIACNISCTFHENVNFHEFHSWVFFMENFEFHG